MSATSFTTIGWYIKEAEKQEDKEDEDFLKRILKKNLRRDIKTHNGRGKAEYTPPRRGARPRR